MLLGHIVVIRKLYRDGYIEFQIFNDVHIVKRVWMTSTETSIHQKEDIVNVGEW